MPTQDVTTALKSIRHRKGKLLPVDVVEAATDPESPLHNYFEWDDSEAAQKYRIWQARQLIVSVGIVSDDDGAPVQMYYSLGADRRSGGGYRDIRDIIADDELREDLLRTAASELAAFKERFQRIKHDLSEVFGAIENLQQRVKRKPASPNRRELVGAGKE